MIPLQNYLIVERTPQFNFSIKLVVPTSCNMRCPFCFNNLNRDTAQHNVNEFNLNFMNSLIHLVETIKKYNPHRTISLDITGNEPTFNIELMKEILYEVKQHYNLFNKIVVTSNGMNILKLADSMENLVDIVNISVHHYDENERSKAFGLHYNYSNKKLSDDYYKEIVTELKKRNIQVSAVAVLYRKLDEPFDNFIDHFTDWCKMIGFYDIRIRSNFYTNDNFFFDYMNSIEEPTRIAKGLASKHFVHKDFPITLLRGVESLVPHVVGVEAVVDDNGMPYLDYGKQHPFIEDYAKHVYCTFP